jgi:hypothetical protein
VNRLERLAGIGWAALFLALAGISSFLATHEAGVPWGILHWTEAVAFVAIALAIALGMRDWRML